MTLTTKAWRRVLLSLLAVAVLLLPAVSQAAPRAAQAPRPAAASMHAGPAQWLARMWHGLTGLWQTVTEAAGTGGEGGAAGSSTTGDAGASIDPDGHHG